MRPTLAVLAAAVGAAVAAWLSLSVPVLLLQPPRIPSAVDLLHRSEIVDLAGVGAFGPESLVFDPQGGGPYTGVSDGRILKWDPHLRSWLNFSVTSPHRSSQGCVHLIKPEEEHECGRPLGLRFDGKSGDLYIADAYWGLLVVGPSGGLATQLASQAEGQPFRFTNDLDIDLQEDIIYFTDTSTRFYRSQFILSPYSGDKTGRLMKYNRTSGEVTVLARGLANANGVALSKDSSFVLVAETTACKIKRYWLKGPNSGNLDTFAELPGFPDNVRRNSNGEFWVALAAKKTRFASWVLSTPWLGRLILKLPLDTKQLIVLLLGSRPHGAIVRLSEEGEVVEILEDSHGEKVRSVSEVEERDGKLWFGSVMMPFIGVYNLH